MALYDWLSVEGGAAEAGRRSPDLDAIRAVAVLAVLAAHAYLLGGSAPPHTSRDPGDMLINAGGQGIWLFFALSGYLISGPFVRTLLRGEPLPPAGGYALRRAARIIPAYWIAFAAILVLLPVAGGLEWWQVPLHGALLHNLVPGEGQALFFVAWTLGIEALFYAFVPLAALAVRRAAGPRPLHPRTLAVGVGALWLASIAWSAWAAAEYPNVGPFAAVANADVFRLSLPALLSVFCPGILMAVALDSGWRPRRPELLAAGALAVGAVALYANTTSSTVVLDLSRQVWAVAAGLALAAALAGWGRLRPLARALAPIGLVSYGLYLWHYVTVRVLEHEGVAVQAGALSWPLRAALVLAISVPLALASWLLVERPLLRRTSLWWRRRSETPRPVAT
ncbi:MAG TPA: acyltransferase [Solirubrobacteraceae bacterium]|nr:acyltransferase [Solirubrobacteraceae bacterium]